MPNPSSCTHIKVTGLRCGSPALRGERFCYFHQRMLRTVKAPPFSRVHHAALLEDQESIQASLMEIVNALLRGTIEVKRAELILRALNTAVRNVQRVHFGLWPDRMVREVPNYPEIPDPEVEEAARVQAERKATAEKIARMKAEMSPANVKPTHTYPSATGATTTHAGTAAPAVPGRSAVPPKSDPPRRTEVTSHKPPLSVKVPEPSKANGRAK